MAARDRRALAMIDENVAIADQYRPHARFSVDAFRQFTTYLQRHVLFFRAFRPDCTGVVPAMTGIDRDDDVATRSIRLRGSFHRCEVARWLEVDNKTIAIGRVRARRECPRAHGCIEIEDHAQLSVGANCAADRAHRACAARHFREMLAESAVFQVDDETVWTAQCEDAVRNGRAEVEHDACFVIFCPYADVLDSRARRRD